ncbi:MAG: hypothetical protein ACP5KE_01085 [Candidatus Methanodesulfokora sp.]
METEINSLASILLQKNSLMIYGRPGTGKSLMMNKISIHLARVGEKVLYMFNHPSAISNLSAETERIVLLSLDDSNLANSLILAGSAMRRGFRLVVVDEIPVELLYSITGMRDILLWISLLSNLARNFSKTLALISDEIPANLKLVSNYVDSVIKLERSGDFLNLEWNSGTKLSLKLF